eukprot:12387472-Prorocentrum_lima.AAC.1
MACAGALPDGGLHETLHYAFAGFGIAFPPSVTSEDKFLWAIDEVDPNTGSGNYFDGELRGNMLKPVAG